MRRIRESIVKCEKYGIDVWVIDHLLSAPGLYGNAWLEPLNSLAYAAALTSKVEIATGILVLPVRHPVLLAKEISTLCHLSNNRYVFGVGPGWYAREYEVTGSRIQERGQAHRRDHRGGDPPPHQAERELPRQATTTSTTSPSTRGRRRCRRSGSRAARACPIPASTTCR